MKRTNIFLMIILSFFFFSQIGIAQDESLEDLLKRIKGKSESTENEKSSPSKPSSPRTGVNKSGFENKYNQNQESVLNLIYPSLYLVRQEYKVLSNGSGIGKSDLPYWGYGLGVGVQVGEKIVMPKHMQSPWEFDETYAEVKLKFPEAVCSQTKIMGLDENTYKNSNESIQLDGEEGLSFINGGNSKLGLMSSNGEGEKYLLVLISVSDMESDSPTTYQTSHELNNTWDNGRMVLENYKVPSNCIGGILFERQQTPGQLTLSVAGIGSMVQNDLLIVSASSSLMASTTDTNNSRGSRDSQPKTQETKAKKSKVKKDKQKSSQSSGRTRGRTRGRG